MADLLFLFNSSVPKAEVRIQDVQAARQRLGAFVRKTPLLPSHFHPALFLKAETLQPTHSFKVRPAFHQLLLLNEESRARGVVASSSGNFGQAVAYAARRLNTSATVVMTQDSSPLKASLTRRWGARIVHCPNDLDAREKTVRELVAEEGLVSVHPYDHPAVIAANGTIGLEILEQHPTVENVVVPISGGGLISGIALALKEQRPRVRIWGVQPAASNATYLSYHQGRRVRIPTPHTLADGLRVAQPGELTFSFIQRYVDEVETVEEDSILEAVRVFFQEERVVVEPSGAVPLALVLEEKVPIENTVLILSGGNITPEVLQRALTSKES